MMCVKSNACPGRTQASTELYAERRHRLDRNAFWARLNDKRGVKTARYASTLEMKRNAM